MLNTPQNKKDLENIDEFGDDHVASNFETPLRADAFEMDDELKMEMIAKHFKEIMHILGMDLSDDSLKGTPQRVAKMYVKEVFSGLNPLIVPGGFDIRAGSNSSFEEYTFFWKWF